MRSPGGVRCAGAALGCVESMDSRSHGLTLKNRVTVAPKKKPLATAATQGTCERLDRVADQVQNGVRPIADLMPCTTSLWNSACPGKPEPGVNAPESWPIVVSQARPPS